MEMQPSTPGIPETSLPQSILEDRIAFIVAGENGEGPLPGRDPGGYHLPALSVDLARSIGTENPAERMGIGYLTDPCRCHGALPRHRRILVDQSMDPGASEREMNGGLGEVSDSWGHIVRWREISCLTGPGKKVEHGSPGTFLSQAEA